jgi:hypothetical protein
VEIFNIRGGDFNNKLFLKDYIPEDVFSEVSSREWIFYAYPDNIGDINPSLYFTINLEEVAKQNKYPPQEG